MGTFRCECCGQRKTGDYYSMPGHEEIGTGEVLCDECHTFANMVLARKPSAGNEHPTQPIEPDQHGVLRFKRNAVVVHLLDKGPFSMNTIACGDFSPEDRRQLAQLIGYSVGGYRDLSYSLPVEINGEVW